MISALLHWAFALLAGTLFLFLSAVLLWRRLFARWVKFSFGYAAAYSLGSWAMFDQLPWALEELRSDPRLLATTLQAAFFLGPLVCVGFGLVRQLDRLQIAGIVVSYLAVLLGFLTVSGLFPAENIALLLTRLPFLGFWIGTPLVLGYAMARGAECGSLVGIFVVWTALLAALAVAVTNYYGVPFLFFYEMSAGTKWLVQAATLAVALLGVPFVVGYGWMHDWSRKTIVGALVIFFTAAGVAALMVTLTVGWSPLFSAASAAHSTGW